MGNIFAELVKAAKHHKLPEKFIYQGEELTKVLANSMGGNSKTILMAAVSPASDSLSETNRCLDFALRASKVKSIVRVEEELSREAMAKLIKDLQEKLCVPLQDLNRDLLEELYVPLKTSIRAFKRSVTPL